MFSEDLIAWKRFPHYCSFQFHLSPVDSPPKGSGMWSLYVFFDVSLNKLSNKQSSCWQFMQHEFARIAPNGAWHRHNANHQVRHAFFLFIKPKFSNRNINMHSIIHPHWFDTGSWNPKFLMEGKDIRSADVLATQGARVSATVILTMLNRNNPVPAR